MGHEPSVVTTEQALGFDTKRGLSRDGRMKAHAIVKTLNAKIDQVKTTYSSLGREGIRKSTALKKATDTLFSELGPRLWPPQDNDRSWLVKGADQPATAEYHRDLYFDNTKDRQLLSSRFAELVEWKCQRYWQNHHSSYGNCNQDKQPPAKPVPAKRVPASVSKKLTAENSESECFGSSKSEYGSGDSEDGREDMVTVPKKATATKVSAPVGKKTAPPVKSAQVSRPAEASTGEAKRPQSLESVIGAGNARSFRAGLASAPRFFFARHLPRSNSELSASGSTVPTKRPRSTESDAATTKNARRKAGVGGEVKTETPTPPVSNMLSLVRKTISGGAGGTSHEPSVDGHAETERAEADLVSEQEQQPSEASLPTASSGRNPPTTASSAPSKTSSGPTSAPGTPRVQEPTPQQTPMLASSQPIRRRSASVEMVEPGSKCEHRPPASARRQRTQRDTLPAILARTKMHLRIHGDGKRNTWLSLSQCVTAAKFFEGIEEWYGMHSPRAIKAVCVRLYDDIRSGNRDIGELDIMKKAPDVAYDNMLHAVKDRARQGVMSVGIEVTVIPA